MKRIYEINISEVVIDETNNTINIEEREKLLGVIKFYEIDAIEINEEAEILARNILLTKYYLRENLMMQDI